MNFTNILAGWVLFQLLFIGFIGGLAYNDIANCNPPPIKEARWDFPIFGMVFPLAFFAQDIQLNKNCPKNSK